MSANVSVIVPVRDRPDLLRLLLEALSRQTYDDFETIVVDDGSVTPVTEVVDAFRDGLCLRYLRTTGVGAVGARCAGVEQARGDVFAFTDSDCEPEPEWLEEGVKAIRSGADVVQGVTRPARSPGVFERSLAYRGGEGLFATCNVFYRREAFEVAGGFDRSAEQRLGFRPGERAKDLGFGEDVLLGWRVARDGRFSVAEGAVVRHAVMRDPIPELLSRTWQIGAFPALVREVPELRETLLRSRVFIGSDSRVPLYLAVGAALVGARRVAVLAAAVWIFTTWRRTPKRRATSRGIVFARDLLLDVVKAVALVVGSLRARTPVL